MKVIRARALNFFPQFWEGFNRHVDTTAAFNSAAFQKEASPRYIEAMAIYCRRWQKKPLVALTAEQAKQLQEWGYKFYTGLMEKHVVAMAYSIHLTLRDNQEMQFRLSLQRPGVRQLNAHWDFEDSCRLL